MGIAERKEREKREMRRKIIDAAFEMFVEVGYERTSIRAIADKIESTARPPSTSITKTRTNSLRGATRSLRPAREKNRAARSDP